MIPDLDDSGKFIIANAVELLYTKGVGLKGVQTAVRLRMAWLSVVLSLLLTGTQSLTVEALEFKAGAAVTSLDPPAGIALAGFGGGARRHWVGSQNPYAYYLTASRGVHDPIRSKALVLQFDQEKLAIVSLDLLIPSSDMHRELARRLVPLGFDESSIIIAATHTHSGPSAYVKNTILELFALDRYVPDVWEHMTDAVEHSIREADARLVPARMETGTRSIAGLTSNRRHKQVSDSLLTVIRIDHADGTPVAAVLNFPVHPTMMGPHNLLLSADLPGAIERAFEYQSGAPAIFLNGAEGDIAPIGPRGEFRLVDDLGGRIAGEALALWKSMVQSLPTPFVKKQVDVDLGPASLNIFPCLKVNGGSGKWNPVLSEWPIRTTLTGFSIGGHAFVAVPGEPVAAIGEAIREQGRRAGFASTSILGLSNEYVGYILPKDDYLRGGYESCVSFYGSSLGDRILAAAAQLMTELSAK